jgi:hypothetical protein
VQMRVPLTKKNGAHIVFKGVHWDFLSLIGV